MKRFAQLHKWIALGFGLFWTLQAASGALLVFQWELDDLVPGFFTPEKQTPHDFKDHDYKGLATGLERLRQRNPDHTPLFLVNSGGSRNLYDLVTKTQAGDRIAYRLSATNGALYKTYYWHGPFSRLDFFRALYLFHTELLSGTIGDWIIGISGIFLATTLILGLYIGWPRNGAIKKALWPKPFQVKIPNLYTWHRAMGLWCGLVLLLISLTGIALVWSAPLRIALDVTPDLAPITQKITGEPISLFDAITVAKQYFPDSELAIINLPQKETPYYQIRLAQPDENRLVYGVTALYISQYGGHILHIYDPLAPKSYKRKAFDALYPLHTGEFWGITGRLLNLAAAFGLIALASLGGLLYYKKLTRQKPSSAKLQSKY